MREYINLVEGNQRLDEVSKKTSQAIDKDVATLKAGTTTYADIEKLWRKWDAESGLFSAASNHFMGRAAQKLGVVGLFAPKGRTFYTTEKDTNSTRFKTVNVPKDWGAKLVGLGVDEKDLNKLAKLDLLPANRVKQFTKDNPEIMKGVEPKKTSPQSNAELDADSNDSGMASAKTGSAVKTSRGSIKDGKITFSTGETFYRDPSGLGLRKFQGHVGKLINRMDDLVRKMNESIPNSLKSVLSESDKAYLLLEALSDKEAQELIDIVADLELAMQAKDEQGLFIQKTNIGLIKDRIAYYKPVIDKASAMLSANAPKDNNKAKDGEKKEVDPEAEKASKDSNDKGADKDAGKKPTAGSLAKFAKSGKGGLANDPDETAAIDELQTYLNDLGFDTGTPDGKYGPGTIKGVKAFQEYFGAKVDGDAGPETIGQIIKLRSIGFKGGKTFVDFRRDMKRMEELLAKSGAKAEGKDMSSMSSILEALRRIDEALDEKEAKELADLVAQYDDVMNDGEFAQAIPKPSYERYKKIWDAAKKLAPETEKSKEFKDGDEIPKEYLDANGNPDWSKIPPEIKTGTINGVGVERPPEDNKGDLSGKLDGKDGEIKQDPSMFKTDVPNQAAEGIWRIEKDDKGTFNLVGPDGRVDTSVGMNGRFTQAKVKEMQALADKRNKEQGLSTREEAWEQILNNDLPQGFPYKIGFELWKKRDADIWYVQPPKDSDVYNNGKKSEEFNNIKDAVAWAQRTARVGNSANDTMVSPDDAMNEPVTGGGEVAIGDKEKQELNALMSLGAQDKTKAIEAAKRIVANPALLKLLSAEEQATMKRLAGVK